MCHKWVAFAVSVLSFWLFRIYQTSPILSIIVLVSAGSLFFLTYFPKITRLRSVFIISLAVVLIFQFRTTNRTSLTTLSNDEQHTQKTRMIDEYPLVRIPVGSKTLWIPAAHWLDGRKEAIAFWKIWKNAGQALDINLYFFGNHPRGRVGIGEFEKLSYTLFPFFFVGILTFNWKRNWKVSFAAFLLPLVLTSIWGHQTPLGPIGLAPFFFATTAWGVYVFFQSVKNIRPFYKNMVYVGLGITHFLVVIQLISYTRY